MWFGVLGPLVVLDDDGRPLPTLSGRLRVLLAALVSRSNSVVSVNELVELVWDGRPPAGARQTLPTYIARLRRTLGKQLSARVLWRSPGYLIRLDDDESDLHRFHALCAEGGAAANRGDLQGARTLLDEAITLWRGDPLADIACETLQRDVGARALEQRLWALETYFDVGLRTNRYAEAVPELHELIARHPLRERLYALLMTALYLDGRQGEALAVYRRAHDVLAEELGVMPGPTLRDLHRRMLNGERVLVSADVDSELPMPAQLPARTADFTGRVEQVRMLRALASHAGKGSAASGGAMVVAAVTGAGGAGKTALALHVAHQLVPEYPDGQLYVALRGMTAPVEPDEALARLLHDLGVREEAIPTGRDGRVSLFRSLLAGRRMLLVLDDARDAAQVRPLLPGAAGCAVLVTSRDRLADLEAAPRLELEGLVELDARELFARIVGQERVASEPEATAEVLGICAGLPLAIRVAGARLATRPRWSIADLAARLHDHGHQLDELKAGDMAVRASFQVSYTTLPPEQAAAFRLLGTAALPTIGVAAAAILFGRTLARTTDILESLVDKHLVQSLASHRYGLHDLLRMFARERAEAELDEATRSIAVRRLVSWYTLTARDAAGILDAGGWSVNVTDQVPDGYAAPEFRGEGDALRWCEQESGNIVVAVERAAEYGHHDLAWRLPVILWRFYQWRWYLCPNDWAGAYRIGLASASAIGVDEGQAMSLDCLAGCHTMRHEMDQALDCLRSALSILRRIDDRRGQALVFGHIAFCLTGQGRYADALAADEQVLEIAGGRGDLPAQAHALACMVWLNRMLGRRDDAIACGERSLFILGNQGVAAHDDLVITLFNLAVTYADGEYFDKAIEHYQWALRACRKEFGDRGHEALTLHFLGHAYLQAGDRDSARQCWIQALDIFSELRDPQAELSRQALKDLNSGPESRHAVQRDQPSDCEPSPLFGRQPTEAIKTTSPSKAHYLSQQPRYWCQATR